MTTAALPIPPADVPGAAHTPPPTAPPAPGGPAAHDRLRRSAGSRMAGGVCGGLAATTGVDALLWRAGFVVLALTGGSGVLLYLLLWVLLPPAPDAPGQAPGAAERLARRLHGRVDGMLGSRG